MGNSEIANRENTRRFAFTSLLFIERAHLFESPADTNKKSPSVIVLMSHGLNHPGQRKSCRTALTSAQFQLKLGQYTPMV